MSPADVVGTPLGPAAVHADGDGDRGTLVLGHGADLAGAVDALLAR